MGDLPIFTIFPSFPIISHHFPSISMVHCSSWQEFFAKGATREAHHGTQGGGSDPIAIFLKT